MQRSIHARLTNLQPSRFLAHPIVRIPLETWVIKTMAARPSSRLALLSLALVAFPAGAWSLDCKFSAERKASLDTTGATRVEVLARAGDLTLRPSTGTALSAAGKVCASHEKYLAQSQVHVSRKGDVVEVAVQLPDESKGIGIFYASLDLAVDVPAGLAVVVTDSSGDVTIDEVRLVRLTDSSGEIVVRDLPGDIEINDSSGDIRVEATAGLVKIVDSSGDIVVRGARDVVIPSDSSGDIVIARVAGSVRIDSDTSGDVSISGVGQNVEFIADSSGDVRVSGVKGTVRVPQ